MRGAGIREVLCGPLNNNKFGSLGRQKLLLKRLKQNLETFRAYDHVIRDQLVNNVKEKVSDNQSENPKEFFLPHRAVIRQNAMSTKLRIVNDASAISEHGILLTIVWKRGHPFKTNCETLRLEQD